MNINPVSNISFSARISKKFVDDVNNYLSGSRNQIQRDNFNAKVDEFKLFGNQNMEVTYKNSYEDGQRMHSLYIEEPGYSPVLLAKKDMFRKLISKFEHINQYEFDIKVKQAREAGK